MSIAADTSAFMAILLKEPDADTYRRALLAQPLFQIVLVDSQQMVLANQAYERFGKSRHPAKLNYGDLFSYALAKNFNLPLLFKGDDFSRTDLDSCV